MREYELTANIPANRELIIRLPQEFRAGAKVVLKIQEQDDLHKEAEDHMQPAMKEFLENLPLNTSGGRSKEEIDAWLDAERNDW